MSDAWLGALAVALASATWGTWKFWLPPGGVLDSAAQGGIVLTVSTIGAGIIWLLTPREPREAPTRRDRMWLLLFGLFESANYLLYFKSLTFGDSAAACVSHYLAPVLVAVATPMLGESLGRRVPVAVVVAFLGTFALVGVGAPGAGTVDASRFGGASAIFYAANILISKRLSRCYTPWELIGLHNMIAAPIVWAMTSTPPWTAGSNELVLAVAGAIVSGTIAAGVYFYGLQRVTAAKTAILSYMEPVSAATFGVLALGEPISAWRVGAMLVVIGAGIAVATERPAPVRVETV